MAFADAGGGSKGGGILDSAKKIAGGALETLGAPQQITYGIGNAIGGLATGNLHDAAAGAKHALAELGSLGQARGNWDFAQAAGTTGKDGKQIAAKLPKGWNTGLGLVADPLLFTGLGKGAEAAEGVGRLAKIMGLTEAEVSHGLATGAIDLSKGSELHNALKANMAADVLVNGSKTNKLLAAGKDAEAAAEADKAGAKIARLTARRGAGGLNAFVPGTDLSKNLIKGERFAAGGALLKKVPGVEKGLDIAGHAFNTTHELAKGYGGDKKLADVIHAKGLDVASKNQAAQDKVIGELTNGVHTLDRAFTVEDNKELLHALETKNEGGFEELLSRKPEMQDLLTASDRIGDTNTREQMLRGLIGTSPGNVNMLTEKLANTTEAAKGRAQELDDLIQRQRVAKTNSRKLREAAEAEARKAGPGSKAAALKRVKQAKAAEDAVAADAAKTMAEFRGQAKNDILQKFKDLGYISHEAEDVQWSEGLKRGIENTAEGDGARRLPNTVEAVKDSDGTTYAVAWDADRNPIGYTLVDADLKETGSGSMRVLREQETPFGADTVHKLDAVNDELKQTRGGDEALLAYTRSGDQADRFDAARVLHNWMQDNPAYQAKVQDALADLPDEITVYRGGANNAAPGAITNVSLRADGAANFVHEGGLPQIFKVNKADVIGVGDSGDMELFIKSEHLRPVETTATREHSGLTVITDPNHAGKGLLNKMYDALDASGVDTAAIDTKTHFTPAGASATAGRRADKAAAVLDHTDPKLVAVAEKARSTADAAEKAAAEQSALIKQAKGLANGADKEASKLDRKIGEARVKVSKLKAAAKQAQKDLDEVTSSNAGVRENYAQRLHTPEAVETAGRNPGSALASEVPGGLIRDLSQKAERARTRFPKMPVDMINELVDAHQAGTDIRTILADPAFAKYVPEDPEIAEHMTKGLEAVADELPKGAHLYEESALGSIMNRNISASHAINSYDYVNELKQLETTVDGAKHPILLTAEDVENGRAVPNGWGSRELPHMGTIYAPHALLNEMEGFIGTVGKDGFVQEVDKAMGAWTKFWKTHATTGVLGALPFAARNGRSNIYLIATDGYRPDEVVKKMVEAWNLENKVRDVAGTTRVSGKFIGTHAHDVATQGLDAVLKQQLTAHEYEMWQAMQKHGITTSGLFPVDFKDSVHDVVRKMSGEKPEGNPIARQVKNVVSANGRVATTGRDFNQSIETNARMAHFMLGMDRYGNAEKAAERVKAVLFDYNDLTAFEKKRLKSVIPFYTFMRKNLPLQLQTLAENPMRVAIPEKISQAVSGGLPENSADYQSDAGSRTINHLIPLFGGQISTPDRPFNAAMDVLSPLTLGIQGRGKEAFRAAANIPSGPILGGLRAAAEIGTGTDMYTGGGVKPGAVSGLQRLAGSQVPSLGRLPGRLGPVTPEKLTGKSKATKTTAAELLKLLSGLRVDKPAQ